MSLDNRRKVFKKTLFPDQSARHEIRARLQEDLSIERLTQSLLQQQMNMDTTWLLIHNPTPGQTRDDFLIEHQAAWEQIINILIMMLERYTSMYVDPSREQNMSERAMILNESIKTFEKIREFYRMADNMGSTDNIATLLANAHINFADSKAYYDAEMEHILSCCKLPSEFSAQPNNGPRTSPLAFFASRLLRQPMAERYDVTQIPHLTNPRDNPPAYDDLLPAYCDTPIHPDTPALFTTASPEVSSPVEVPIQEFEI